MDIYIDAFMSHDHDKGNNGKINQLKVKLVK